MPNNAESPTWLVNARKGKNISASESVTQGHPDMLMDVVVDSVIDSIYVDIANKRETMRLAGDSRWEYLHPESARIAIDGLVKGDEEGGMLSLAGEVTVPDGVTPRYEEVTRNTIKEIGYDDPNAGFWYGLPDLQLHITQQSENIASGVNKEGGKTGAGDQGICFGYATNEHPSLMPLPIQMAHALTARLTAMRSSFSWLKPDGKSQVGINYINGKPKEVTHITLAAAHDRNHSLIDVRRDLHEAIILPVLDQFNFKLPVTEFDLLTASGPIIINGAGEWNDKWGPIADSGEVGRKLDVSTYGGAAPHGGGALSGKDPSKVDRSAKYAARYVASQLVKEGFAERLKLGLTYTIGQEHPDSITVDMFGTDRRSWGQTINRISEILDLSVAGIIDGLQLLDTKYAPTARNGHFGHAEFPWEKPAR